MRTLDRHTTGNHGVPHMTVASLRAVYTGPRAVYGSWHPWFRRVVLIQQRVCATRVLRRGRTYATGRGVSGLRSGCDSVHLVDIPNQGFATPASTVYEVVSSYAMDPDILAHSMGTFVAAMFLNACRARGHVAAVPQYVVLCDGFSHRVIPRSGCSFHT